MKSVRNRQNRTKSNKSKTKNQKAGFWFSNKKKTKSSSKSNNNNNNLTKYKKLEIETDDDACYEYHNTSVIPLTNPNKCGCFCLEQSGNKINKKSISKKYKDCSGKYTNKESKKCASGQYLWGSLKTKTISKHTKCASKKKCWKNK